MDENILEVTHDDLLLEIGKLYIQNTYKDKIIFEMREKLKSLSRDIKSEEQE